MSGISSINQSSSSLDYQFDNLHSQIKKNIKRFCRYGDENLDKIYDDIFVYDKDRFSEEDRRAIVDIILIDCRGNTKSLTLWKAFQSKIPEYELTSFQKIILDIRNDTSRVLDYSKITDRLTQGGCFTKENLDCCVDIAFTINHPLILHPATDPVKVNDYTLNFLWINLNPQDRIRNSAENIFGDGSNDRQMADFYGKLSLWADLHPQVSVNLWVDTALLTERAVNRAFEDMQSLSAEKNISLKLRDVRSIAKVQSSMQRYFHPAIPVYFRVDLAKVLIADELMLDSDHFKYVVISDIDITPLPSELLFDQRTVDFLDQFGFVLNRCGSSNIENSFFIYKTGNEKLRDTHAKFLIEGIDHKMNCVEKEGLQSFLKAEYRFSSQSVFNEYCRFAAEMEWGMKDRFDFAPRKVVGTPLSQFCSAAFGDDYTDHRNEEFRFASYSLDEPYVRKGRAMKDSGNPLNYVKLSAFSNWEPTTISLDVA
ncbi:MAG: hypothetical protein FJZ57_05010 [Chlamydiae bacterium]|nr:hypothetical protein [Chlamydiota bacterium]